LRHAHGALTGLVTWGERAIVAWPLLVLARQPCTPAPGRYAPWPHS